jgi:hypothetical protein
MEKAKPWLNKDVFVCGQATKTASERIGHWSGRPAEGSVRMNRKVNAPWAEKPTAIDKILINSKASP